MATPFTDGMRGPSPWCAMDGPWQGRRLHRPVLARELAARSMRLAGAPGAVHARRRGNCMGIAHQLSDINTLDVHILKF